MCYNESFIWAQITTPLTLSSLLASGQFTEKKASLNAGTQEKKKAVYSVARGLSEPGAVFLLRPWLCKTTTAINETQVYIISVLMSEIWELKD